MSEYHFTPRRIGLFIVGLFGLLMMPFGSAGVRIAAWARRKRDG